MNINENIILKSKNYIARYDANMYIYDVDGIQVVFLNTINNCSELAFCATIYNNHVNNKGLPHLTEHCIFGGSKNYDINEPFEYLVQNEKYTYLNAITFKDRTTCLFSSYNEKSFFNILDVYLDAVFNPLLRHKTFKQECFREEMSQSGEIIKNGIVYNEMLDMYSNKEYLNENTLASKFNKNYLKFNAHGKPSDIVSTTNEEVIGYYKDNYTKDNIQLSFYGDFSNNELSHYNILNKIFEITKNTPMYSKRCLDNDTNGKYELNVESSNSDLNIVVALQCQNVLEEKLCLALLKAVFTKHNLIKKLNEKIEIIGLDFKVDNTNRDLIVTVTVTTSKKVVDVQKKDILELIMNCIESDNHDIEKNFYDIMIEDKTKDYGYKTHGIFNLLEISKLKSNVLEFINVEYTEEIQNSLEFLNLVRNTFIKIRTKFTNILGENIQNLHVDAPFVLKLKKNEEKFDKLFKNSTKCVIIDIIIIIKFNNRSGNCVKSFKINVLHDFKNAKKFEITNCYMQWLGYKNNEMYVNLSVLTDNQQNVLDEIKNILQNNDLENIFEFTEFINLNNELDHNYSVLDLIELELSLLNKKLFTEKTINEHHDRGLEESKISWEIFRYDNGSFCFESSGVSQHSNNYFDTKSVRDNNYMLNSEKVLEQEVNKKINTKKSSKKEIMFQEIINQSKLYKNILILEIEITEKVNFFYIELLLEALLNERLYKIVRLKNGAYEVNYKLFKLDNRVVIYSNVDKYSFETLETFKKELNNLNELSLSQIKKYSNKLTNNFYRNEQNKNIKIYKDFVNYTTNYKTNNEFIDDSKVAEAIYVLQNSKIVLEKSFS